MIAHYYIRVYTPKATNCAANILRHYWLGHGALWHFYKRLRNTLTYLLTYIRFIRDLWQRCARLRFVSRIPSIMIDWLIQRRTADTEHVGLSRYVTEHSGASWWTMSRKVSSCETGTARRRWKHETKQMCWHSVALSAPLQLWTCRVNEPAICYQFVRESTSFVG